MKPVPCNRVFLVSEFLIVRLYCKCNKPVHPLKIDIHVCTTYIETHEQRGTDRGGGGSLTKKKQCAHTDSYSKSEVQPMGKETGNNGVSLTFALVRQTGPSCHCCMVTCRLDLGSGEFVLLGNYVYWCAAELSWLC